jgi:prepilin-type N-terminal cleavage/methylation domain-containing protein
LKTQDRKSEIIQPGDSQGEKGFSMVELLVSIALFGAGVLAYGGMTGTIIGLDKRSKMESIAVTLAQDKIEYFKNVARSNELPSDGSLSNPVLSGGVWDSSGDEVVDELGATGGSDARYTRTWTIEPVAGSNHLFDVGVDVAWVDKSSRSETLHTLINQNVGVALVAVAEQPEPVEDDSAKDKDKDKDKDSDSAKDKDKDKDSDSAKDKDKDKDSDSAKDKDKDSD